MDLQSLSPDNLSGLSDEEFEAALAEVVKMQEEDRRECQILYYRPSQPNARKIAASDARIVGVGGGNRSSKTTSCMVRWVALATGIIPTDLWDELRPKFKGPLRVRMVIESHTTTLVPIILPKLQWWSWSGLPPHGGEKGHWGWIPRMCLVKGEWDKSWSEKTRTLKVLCRDPDDHEKILGYSNIQFMSFDQDPSDFASGDFDIIHEDEPPPHAAHRENEARIMSVGGMMLLSMTWPDDPSIPVDWIYDEIYERGLEGPNKSEDIDWFELDSLANPHIDREAVAKQAEAWDETTRKVRIMGQPLRFSNRIHPLFSDTWQAWCFSCGKLAFLDGDICSWCGGRDTTTFNHVQEFHHDASWPCVFVLDPHPRKPHMFAWAQIDPADDVRIVCEGRIDGDPVELRDEVYRMEKAFGLNVAVRIMDPNMGRSPASSKRGVTWQDEFNDVGLVCDLADDSDVGRGRINEYLKPDRHTLQPRFHVHPRCLTSIAQMKRYVWDEYRRNTDKDQKQIPKNKNDDYPTLFKYLMNMDPLFSFLKQGAPVIPRRPREGVR